MRHLCGFEVIVLCMDPEDRDRWDLLDRRAKFDNRARLPCVDCTPEFASQMMAQYRCNGFPGMRYPPRAAIPVRRLRRYGPQERQERRRASWRAYRARVRARAMTGASAEERT